MGPGAEVSADSDTLSLSSRVFLKGHFERKKMLHPSTLLGGRKSTSRRRG